MPKSICSFADEDSTWIFLIGEWGLYRPWWQLYAGPQRSQTQSVDGEEECIGLTHGSPHHSDSAM